MNTSNNNFKTSFYLKKNISRNGLCPVMGRIFVGKDMAQFSCKIDADPALWDAHSGRVSGKSHHARTVNRKIDRINVAVNAKYSEILAMKGTVTANEVKNVSQGISASQETLLSVFRAHNEEYKRRVGVNIARSTWRNYDVAIRHLENFIKLKYHVADLHFKQLDYSFIENFDYYLRIDLKLATDTVAHIIKKMRKMVKKAFRMRIINIDPFADYSPVKSKPVPRYVPMEELEILMKTPAKSAAQEFTRDMFVFSSFTGLAYIDLFNLTNSQIVKTDDGTLWLKINRQKRKAPHRNLLAICSFFQVSQDLHI